MTDPLPTDYEDGQTIYASHINGTNDAVNDLIEQVAAIPLSGEPLLISGTVSNESGLPPSAELGEVLVDEETGNGFQWNGLGWTNFGQFRGDVGPEGPAAADSGLLSARPDADDVSAGFIYTATDEGDGTPYFSTGAAWVRLPSAAESLAGVILGRAFPTPSASSPPASSIAGIACNNTSTTFRVPELTTASFTMPDRPVTARMSNFVALQSAVVTASSFAIIYTTNAWSSQTVASLQNGVASGGIEGIAGTLSAVIDATPGATVQVALGINRSGDTNRTITIYSNATTPAKPFLEVVCG